MWIYVTWCRWGLLLCPVIFIFVLIFGVDAGEDKALVSVLHALLKQSVGDESSIFFDAVELPIGGMPTPTMAAALACCGKE